MTHATRSHIWLVLPMVCLLSSCSGRSGLFDSSRVSRQHEAGSVHVSVVSVAPWNEYVTALQPSFELTEEEALQMVVPSTRTLESSLIDALRASGSFVRAKPTTRESLSESTTTTTTDETISGEESVDDQGDLSSEQDVSGETTQQTVTRQRTTPDPYSPQIRPGDHVPLTEVIRDVPQRALEPTADMDPFLRYSAATALFQEVQLLNRYVKDAAVREGFTPYALRLQVALMPRMRNEPYDAYCTLSFFSDLPEAEEVELLALADGPSLRTLLRGAEARSTPQVIPLLVTDNLESTLASHSSETIRQLAGSLYIMSGQLGGALGLDSFRDQFESVFGKDLNSLLTVGRVSDNTIRVRLGAMQQASSNFAMVPRAHNITVLLMVPSQLADTTVQVVSRTTMVDVDTGEALPDRTAEQIESEVRSVVEKYGLSELSSEALWRLIGHVQSNDQTRFLAELRRSLGDGHDAIDYGKSLWVDLALLTLGSQYATTTLDLPLRQAGSSGEPVLFPMQTVLVREEPTSGRAFARVHGTALADAADLQAILYILDQQRSIPWRAQEIELDPVTGDLQLVFPSLSSWGLAESAAVVGNLSLYLSRFDQRTELAALYRAESR